MNEALRELGIVTEERANGVGFRYILNGEQNIRLAELIKRNREASLVWGSTLAKWTTDWQMVKNDLVDKVEARSRKYTSIPPFMEFEETELVTNTPKGDEINLRFKGFSNSKVWLDEGVTMHALYTVIGGVEALEGLPCVGQNRIKDNFACVAFPFAHYSPNVLDQGPDYMWNSKNIDRCMTMAFWPKGIPSDEAFTCIHHQRESRYVGGKYEWGDFANMQEVRSKELKVVIGRGMASDALGVDVSPFHSSVNSVQNKMETLVGTQWMMGDLVPMLTSTTAQGTTQFVLEEKTDKLEGFRSQYGSMKLSGDYLLPVNGLLGLLEDNLVGGILLHHWVENPDSK